jgi:hypothetical protein
MAPEIIKMKHTDEISPYTVYSDVWAFGMVLSLSFFLSLSLSLSLFLCTMDYITNPRLYHVLKWVGLVHCGRLRTMDSTPNPELWHAAASATCAPMCGYSARVLFPL